MLIVYHNRRHPRVDVPCPSVLQPHGRSYAVLGLVSVAVLIGLALVVWVAYDMGRQNAGFHSERATEVQDELEVRIDELETERSDLHQQVATLQRDAQIEHEAAKKVQASLVVLQDERLELREEITLLNSLLSDGEHEAALRVLGFELTRQEEGGPLRLRFSVSKLPQSDKQVKADLQVTVIGSEAGKDKRLTLKELAVGDSPDRIAFKQLAHVEEEIEIPGEFEPSKVKVVAKAKSGDVLDAEREFPWAIKP